MAQNSLEDNAAGATKIVVNTLITGQVVSKVAQLSAATGQMLIEGANDLKNIVSPGMQNGAINYITNANGTVSVGIEGIAAAQVVADGTSLIDPATRFAQATNLFSKANNSNGGGNGPESKGDGDKGKPFVEPQRKESPVWDNTTKEFFDNIKKNSAKDGFNNKFGNVYKDPKTD